MKVIAAITHQIELFWKFLGFFQKPFFRISHLIIILLVLLQLISSSGMKRAITRLIMTGKTTDNIITPEFFMFIPTWYHFGAGLLLCAISVYLLVYCLYTRGIRNYFPYLFLDFSGVKKDIDTIKMHKMFGPHPGGILTIIHGLGIITLILVAFSGGTWFLDRQLELGYAPFALDIHKAIASFIGIFIIIHGGLGLIRFIYWQYTVKEK